jgi:hypothetical protein
VISEETERPEGFPELAWHGVRRYILNGIRPGQGLRAFLEGDLFEVYRRCDEEFLGGMGTMVRFLAGPCPQGCYGSKERVALWMAHRGMRGLERPTRFVDFEIQESYIEFRTGPEGEVSEWIYRQAENFFAHAKVRRTSMEGDNDEEWVRFCFEPPLALEEAEALERMFDGS